MPRTTKKSKVNKKVSVRSNKSAAINVKGFLSQIKWGESYTSLFLGAAVVIAFKLE